MSAAVVRLLAAAEWMRLEANPFWTELGGWLTGVAERASMLEPHQTPDHHAAYLTTGERASASAIADAYLTTITEGATP